LFFFNFQRFQPELVAVLRSDASQLFGRRLGIQLDAAAYDRPVGVGRRLEREGVLDLDGSSLARSRTYLTHWLLSARVPNIQHPTSNIQWTEKAFAKQKAGALGEGVRSRG
jgi:hypothetical protein